MIYCAPEAGKRRAQRLGLTARFLPGGEAAASFAGAAVPAVAGSGSGRPFSFPGC